MKTNQFLLACAALAFFNFQLSTAFAQGTAFTYQGVLSQSGASVNGSNDLTFALYDAASGGNTVGTSNVVNDLVMSNGSFTVTLDFGAGAFNGAPRWLQIAARPGNSTGSFTNLAPRQPITPTPYAIYASGASASGLSGTIGGSQIAPGSIDATHITNTVSFWNRSGSTISYNGGSVGIGTANPATRLHVSGDGFTDNGRLTVETTGNGFGPQLRLKKGGAGGEEWVLVANGSINGSVGDLNIVQQGTGQSRFTITTAGNVGIGNTTPRHKLDVNGNIFLGTAASGQLFAELGDTLYLGSSRKYLSSTLGAPVVGQTDWLNLMCHPFSQGIMFGTSGPSDSDPHSAPNPLMVIQSGGNVGIGTTSPARKLTVNTSSYGIEHTDGNVRLSTYLEPSGGWIGTVSPHDFHIFVNDGGASMTIGTNNNTSFAGEITCTAINITSDRNAKEQFKPINARQVLDKVARLPISEWQYKTQGDARHIGPMAQDFREAFTLGHDEKHISMVDESGVALAAIQGLNEKLEEKTQEVDALKQSVAALTALVKQLAARQNGAAQ
jgi:hypothetical protein